MSWGDRSCDWPYEHDNFRFPRDYVFKGARVSPLPKPTFISKFHPGPMMIRMDEFIMLG